MKITHKELSQFYKSYIDHRIPPSRKGCPSIKKIIKFFNPRSSLRQKTKIIDHLTQCTYCAQEFESILQVFRYEKKLNEEISQWLLLEKISFPHQERLSERIFLFRLSWKNVWLILGGVFIVFSFLVSFNKNIPWDLTRPEYRGTQLSPIYLIEPKNKDYLRSRLVFQWKEFPESKYYILELYDETLAPVWKSPKIFKNTCSLPDEILKNLARQKSYFWMITAYLSDGNRLESNLETFTLRD